MRDHRIKRKTSGYLVALLRDDIHIRMQQVILDLREPVRTLQRQHITVLLRSINRWEVARRRQYRYEAHWAACYGTESTLDSCLYRGREMIETQLAACEHVAANLLLRIHPLTFTFFDHDSEYLGPQELDPGYQKGESNHGLTHPWLARRPTNYWFDHTGAGYSPVTVIDDDEDIMVMPSVLMQSVRLGIPGLEDWEADFDTDEQRAHSPPPLSTMILEWQSNMHVAAEAASTPR